MLDAELLLDEVPRFPEEPDGHALAEEIEHTPLQDEAGAQAGAEIEAERLFCREIGRIVLLSREEEDALAQRIVRARQRVRRILRRVRRLSDCALETLGRGVIGPAEDFREREAIVILEYARRSVGDASLTEQSGLEPHELRTFIDELSEALAEYRALRDRMVQSHLRLVALFARRRHRSDLTFLDFIQEGTLGLIRAVEKYEPSRNVKFSTYAIYWIWQQIARAADIQGPLVRTPVHWSQFRRRMQRAIQQAAAESDSTVSAEEWAAAEGIEPERARAMTLSFQFLSTDTPLSNEDDRPMESLLTSTDIEPEQQLLQTDLRQRLAGLVDQLPAREAEIMRLRFGLSATESETLEEVGARFGVSRERVRQLENRALKRLRELCYAQGLEDYLH